MAGDHDDVNKPVPVLHCNCLKEKILTLSNSLPPLIPPATTTSSFPSAVLIIPQLAREQNSLILHSKVL
jgi:hypothetical protein